MPETIARWVKALAVNNDLGPTAYRIVLQLLPSVEPKYFFEATHQELADALGVPRQQITRAFKYLLQENFIKKSGSGQYRIHDRFLVNSKGHEQKGGMVLKEYKPELNVYLGGINKDDRFEVAGILRGLKCAIDRCSDIHNLSNERIANLPEDEPIKLEFSSPEKASYYQKCARYYFADHILESLKLKRVYREMKFTNRHNLYREERENE